MVQNGNSNADGNAIIALPFEHGKRSLLFSRKSILGIITDPPVNVKVQVQPKTEERVPAIPGKEILVLKNFLPADLNRRLMEYAAAQEKNFVPSTVTTNEADYRNSRVLYKPSEFSRLFRDILTSNFSKVISSLDIEQLSLGEIEVQITSHGDGGYYKVHRDSSAPQIASRVISFVYYFYREPRKFTGGEFRIYDGTVSDGAYRRSERFTDLVPENNSIIFFPSSRYHEVLPVLAPSELFADGRFTVNGWLRRAE